jgi:hypothetical protein
MSNALKTEATGDSAAMVPTVSPERITIPVTGMTCSACQFFVQRTLADQGRRAGRSSQSDAAQCNGDV